MFAIVKDIIIKETAYDITHDSYYHSMFQNMYPKIFEDTQGDTIVDCNRNLIDTLCPIIIQKIQAQTKVKRLSPIPETETPKTTTPSKTLQDDTIHVYSNQRQELTHDRKQNRYDYYVTLSTSGDMILHKITLPEEDNPLFGFPTVTIKITSSSHTYTIVCELEDTKYLGDRNYISYVPDSRVMLSLETDISIEILNYSGTKCIVGNDIYQCTGFKHITTGDGNFTCLKLQDTNDTCQFQPKDTISIYQDNKLIGNVLLLRIMPGYLLCKQDLSLTLEGIYQIMDLSLQNHITFLHPHQ